jgi:SAM-dependent methyltransferase
MDLSHRRRQAEIMDEPDLDPQRHYEALRGLARINRISRSSSILWRQLSPILKANASRTITVLDVASGAGDVPIALSKKAHRRGQRLEIVGWDVSPHAVAYARRRAELAGAAVSFEVRDALTSQWDQTFDVVCCSLFLHHLEEADAIELLKRMGRWATQAVIVNDLRRCGYGYWLARCGTRILTRSDVVHFDGPASVESAFTIHEVRALARSAGQSEATIRPRWPARFVYHWTPT